MEDLQINFWSLLTEGVFIHPYSQAVHWAVQNVMLEDVERIEVIRGPGGVLWGANAVNGIISIITKKSKNTQGGF